MADNTAPQVADDAAYARLRSKTQGRAESVSTAQIAHVERIQELAQRGEWTLSPTDRMNIGLVEAARDARRRLEQMPPLDHFSTGKAT